MALSQINIPVDPKAFLTRFEQKFTKWGNIVTQPLQDTWFQNALVFNNVIANTSNNIKYIVSAPTGSAKTENTITYCAMLPREITVLISTNLTAEADRLAEDINREANEERAIAYHSKNITTITEASQYQIIVVSHEFYKKHHQGSEIWNKLGEKRQLIIIDEALDTIEESSVCEADINVALNFFSALFRKSLFSQNTHFHNNLKSLLEDFNFLVRSPIGTVLKSSTVIISAKNTQGQVIKIHALHIHKYFYFLTLLDQESFHFNHILTGIKDSSHDKLIKEKIINVLETLNSFHNRQTYTTANNGQYSIHRVINYLQNKSLVCFDATADVNETYALRLRYHNDIINVPRIQGVRDYSSVTLYSTPTSTGANTITKETIEALLQHCTFGKKTLVVTHKKNKPLVEDLVKKYVKLKTIDIAHWNAITGLNNWQDFDTCIIIGLNHKPISFVQNRLLVCTDEVTAFGALQKTYCERIQETNLVAEIIQAINRICIRKVTNASGGCASANIYVTLPTFNYNNYLLAIEQHMPNIQLKSLALSVIQQTTQPQTHISSILSYLAKNLSSGDRISIYEPRDKLNINKESYLNVVGKQKKVVFETTLKTHGYELVELSVPGAKKGYYKKERFIQKL